MQSWETADRSALEGLLSPEEREVVLGEAEVRQTFKISGVGVVAGCFVRHGVIRRGARIRVVRDGVEVYHGGLASLKRFKDHGRDVKEGLECGIGVENFNDVKVGDLLESYVAGAVLRGPEKGGKSVGIRHNQLSAEGRQHPWFGRFARGLRDGEHFPVLDNRLYDLMPTGAAPADERVLVVECDEEGSPGTAVTMVEVADDSRGAVPRILGVNHHPEIVNRQRQLALLEKKRARGGVNEEWFAERWTALTQPVDNERDDRVLHLTSSYTLMGPLRAALYREVRLRGEALGANPGFHERDMPLVYSLEHSAVLPF